MERHSDDPSSLYSPRLEVLGSDVQDVEYDIIGEDLKFLLEQYIKSSFDVFSVLQ
jgi:hypothetical protein